MKSNWNLLKAGALLFALPLMATAAVSASQWVNDSAPIDLNVEVAEVVSSIGVTRVHAVALNSSGAIEGRVASMDAQGTQGIADLSVQFMKNGKVIQETMTSSDGSFRVEGLNEGNYSFVASGENGFAAYGVQVVSETAGVDNVMEASAVAPGVSIVKQILDNNLPEKFSAPAESVKNPIVGANRVNLVDGKLVGTVRSLDNASVAGTLVHILSGEKQVAQVETNEDGSFSIADMKPGVYNFVSTGPSGYAAVSFEAVNEVATDVEIPVSFSPAAAIQEFGFSDSLDVCTTCGTDAGFGGDVVYDQAPVYEESFAPVEYASESIGCGGSCGASCGSCGNFSNVASSCSSCGGAASGGGRLFGGGGGRLFGGRFGRLALIGAAVGIAVPLAISGDNDNIDGPASNENP